MASQQGERRPIPGSEREPASGATLGGPVNPREEVEVTIHLRRPGGADSPADPGDVAAVRRVLEEYGIPDVRVDEATRRVFARGGAGDLSRLFGTTLVSAESPDPASGEPVRHRHRTGELSVPAELAGLVTAVLGLDDRPQGRPHFRAASAQAGRSGYLPGDLAAAYQFPPGTDGSGQTVAFVELGGGYRDSDLSAYFAAAGVNQPAVQAVPVDGASNAPTGNPNGPDGEVALDIEVAGGLAPRATFKVYFAPNTDRGFVDAVTEAGHATPVPTAISISWGSPENQWTGQARSLLDTAIADAAARGATVCAAAGDNGSSDGESDGAPHVDFPASSPHALGCGGTRLELAGGGTRSETVWNDQPADGATGGGVSVVFPLPSWQSSAGVPGSPSGGVGRGVPDVAGNADPATGYQVVVDGATQVIGGTSAVAPLWAALLARLAQAVGRPLGLVQPALYAATSAGRAAPGFHDITSGSNGAYSAGTGWDACTGLGSPVGTQLQARLSAGG